MTIVADYPYIVIWEALMGSSATYTERRLARARATKAPPDAVYELTVGNGAAQWVRASEIVGGLTRHRFTSLCTERGIAPPEFV